MPTRRMWSDCGVGARCRRYGGYERRGGLASIKYIVGVRRCSVGVWPWWREDVRTGRGKEGGEGELRAVRGELEDTSRGWENSDWGG